MYVGAIIKNLHNEFLLQQRDNNAPTFRKKWTLFGGEVNPGETLSNAILRELNEEIGLTDMDIKSLQQVQANRQNNGALQFIFEIVIHAPDTKLQLSEGERFCFVSKKALFNRSFAFNIKEVLETYIRDYP